MRNYPASGVPPRRRGGYGERAANRALHQRERLNEIIAAGHRALGTFIANPHVYTLEDGVGHKEVDAVQFKRHADPLGVLNLGKMRTYAPAT